MTNHYAYGPCAHSHQSVSCQTCEPLAAASCTLSVKEGCVTGCTMSLAEDPRVLLHQHPMEVATTPVLAGNKWVQGLNPKYSNGNKCLDL